MVLVDGPAVLPIEVADDADEAAETPEATEIPLLPLSEMPPERSSPGALRNLAVERQLSPSKFRLKQRAAEMESSRFALGDEGEVGEDERQEAEADAAEEEVVPPSSPSKVKRFSQLTAEGGLPKWNHFYTEGTPPSGSNRTRHTGLEPYTPHRGSNPRLAEDPRQRCHSPVLSLAFDRERQPARAADAASQGEAGSRPGAQQGARLALTLSLSLSLSLSVRLRLTLSLA